MEENKRPHFPARAIVTAGMPYGNKELHFGHIGGVFIPADVFARFLRDRIGKENVIFVSGTDCYGSTIEGSFEAAQKEGFSGSIEDFVMQNHQKQKAVLDMYDISPDLFGASALGRTGEIHRENCKKVFDFLKSNGFLSLQKTKQFYDDKLGVFLNGRQVIGRCPIQGCKSEHAYADECSLGHQFNADELIAPKSVLSGETPSITEVDNWYFDLEAFRNDIEKHVDNLEKSDNCRENVISVMREFLKKPCIYIKKEELERVKTLNLGCEISVDDSKPSFMAIFDNLDRRAAACKVLSENGIRYRTGKTVVPFRISGNAKWGAPIPPCEGVKGLTFWVWPESLWAPISFTMAALENRGENPDKYKDFWCDKDAEVYQFIGEDNIYFYGVAQTGLFLGLQGKDYKIDPENGKLRLTNLVANHHLLFGKKKASSSGENKPPKADELLDYYTAEQLRMHFINASLAEQSVGFEPLSVLRPDDVKKGGFDTVLYEGNLLTNVYNRLVRSCFYTVAKHFDGVLPAGKTSAQTTEFLKKTVLEYEQLMYRYKFDKIFELLNIAIKEANKIWARDSKAADAQNDENLRKQLLIDSFSIVRTMAVLLHPFAPSGCEIVREYLGLSQDMYDWSHIFENIEDITAQGHKFKTLEPKFDFFAKHPNQIGG